jgi:ABC-2 type transport system ATP-binding protein
VRSATLTTFEVTGPRLFEFAEAIRGKPGIEQIVAFGNTLHVSGRQPEKLRASIAGGATNGEHHWVEIESSLEDVFISLMESAKDN